MDSVNMRTDISLGEFVEWLQHIRQVQTSDGRERYNIPLARPTTTASKEIEIADQADGTLHLVSAILSRLLLGGRNVSVRVISQMDAIYRHELQLVTRTNHPQQGLERLLSVIYKGLEELLVWLTGEDYMLNSLSRAINFCDSSKMSAEALIFENAEAAWFMLPFTLQFLMAIHSQLVMYTGTYTELVWEAITRVVQVRTMLHCDVDGASNVLFKVLLDGVELSCQPSTRSREDLLLAIILFYESTVYNEEFRSDHEDFGMLELVTRLWTPQVDASFGKQIQPIIELIIAKPGAKVFGTALEDTFWYMLRRLILLGLYNEELIEPILKLNAKTSRSELLIGCIRECFGRKSFENILCGNQESVRAFPAQTKTEGIVTALRLIDHCLQLLSPEYTDPTRNAAFINECDIIMQSLEPVCNSFELLDASGELFRRLYDVFIDRLPTLLELMWNWIDLQTDRWKSRNLTLVSDILNIPWVSAFCTAASDRLTMENPAIMSEEATAYFNTTLKRLSAYPLLASAIVSDDLRSRLMAHCSSLLKAQAILQPSSERMYWLRDLFQLSLKSNSPESVQIAAWKALAGLCRMERANASVNDFLVQNSVDLLLAVSETLGSLACGLCNCPADAKEVIQAIPSCIEYEKTALSLDAWFDYSFLATACGDPNVRKAYLQSAKRVLCHLDVTSLDLRRHFMPWVVQCLKSSNPGVRLLARECIATLAARVVRDLNDGIAMAEKIKLLDGIIAWMVMMQKKPAPTIERFHTLTFCLCSLSCLESTAHDIPSMISLLEELIQSNLYKYSSIIGLVYEIATRKRVMPLTVLQPVRSYVCLLVTQDLLNDPTKCKDVALLYQKRVESFLLDTLEYHQPTLVLQDRWHALEESALILGMSLRDYLSICPEYILLPMLFMPTDKAKLLSEKLESLLQVDSIDDLYRLREKEMFAAMLLELGKPEDKDYVTTKVQLWLDTGEHAASRSSNTILFYLNKINKFMKNEETCLTKQTAIRSLKVMLELHLCDLTSVLPQIISNISVAFNTACTRELSLEAFSQLLRREERINVNLNQMLNTFTGNAKIIASGEIDRILGEVLHQVLELSDVDLRSVSPLTIEPRFEQFNRALLEKRKDENELSTMRRLTKQLNTDNMSELLGCLRELQSFLRNASQYLAKMLELDVISDTCAALMSTLLRLASKFGSRGNNVSILCANCIGLLGALDPARMRHDARGLSTHHIDDIHVLDSNGAFVRFIKMLISGPLVNAHQHAMDPPSQDVMGYAIQVCLKLPGLADSPTSPEDIDLHRHFRSKKKFIAPFYESEYVIDTRANVGTDYPLYPQCENGAEWLQRLTLRLVRKTPFPPAHEVLNACEQALFHDSDLNVCRFMLPFAALAVVVRGDDEEFTLLLQEFLSILSEEDVGGYSNKRKACCQLQRRDEDLDNLYTQLQELYSRINQPDAVQGLKVYMRKEIYEQQVRSLKNEGEWAAALDVYRMKYDSEPDDIDTKLGRLEFYEKLEHFDFLKYIARHSKYLSKQQQIFDLGVVAAWHTSDWHSLAPALKKTNASNFDVMTGRLLLALTRQDRSALETCLTAAKQLEMVDLSVAGLDSYERSYVSVHRLHMLHEMAEVGQLLASIESGTLETGAFPDLQARWISRLSYVDPSAQAREPILHVRRLLFSAIEGPLGAAGGDSTALKNSIAELWRESARSCRRQGDLDSAERAVRRAAYWGASFIFVDRAKLMWLRGDHDSAIVHLRDNLRLVPESDEVKKAKVMLRLTNWMETVSESDVVTLRSQYESILQTHATWEKAHYRYGRFMDELQLKVSTMSGTTMSRLDSNLSTTQSTSDSKKSKKSSLDDLIPANSSNDFILTACKQYAAALRNGSRYLYHTMPRFLTLWLNTCQAAMDDPEDKSLQALAKELKRLILRSIAKLQSSQYLAFFSLITSRISHADQTVVESLTQIIGKVLREYPQQSLWMLMFGYNSREKTTALGIRTAITRYATKSDRLHLVNQFIELNACINELCSHKANKTLAGIKDHRFQLMEYYPSFRSKRFVDVVLPLQSVLTSPIMRGVMGHQDHPHILEFSPEAVVMKSVAQPVRVHIRGSDGKLYPFLLKGEDDLRKDARIMEFNTMINNFFKRDIKTTGRDFRRTYGVVPLTKKVSIVEWVPDTIPMRNLIEAQLGGISLMFSGYKGGSKTELAAMEEKHPPALHDALIRVFPQPDRWLKGRTNYTTTTAVMAMVGFILGLGDRHCENILLDLKTGDIVHIDFDCLFDRGFTLPIPERVPFRLTRNVVNGFGVTGYNGIFRKAAEAAISLLRREHTSLMAVLQTYQQDPIMVLSRTEVANIRSNPLIEDRRQAIDVQNSLELERSLAIVRAKLGGKLPDYRRAQAGTTDSQLSIEGQVRRLIEAAGSHENLCYMYKEQVQDMMGITAPRPRATSALDEKARVYAIVVVQQPQHARSAGFGDKDRRPLDPLPIIKLTAYDDFQCPLEPADERGEWGIFAAFPDLSVRVEGEFRLKFSLVRLGTEESPIVASGSVVATAHSDIFRVYHPRRFPGMLESTPLSRALARQGISIPIRNTSARERQSRETDTSGNSEY
ncbi:hypothetical protein BZG36_03524 [Bifiguratus adelaidae]|uniref:Serine/threonine-protein kinase ATR n=1 Tax=Bifiguratus adelaidae TaxID=1938954 RepID=A0A261XY47_9FUNG|nr:hypothetical protein BZG36_03524 [Bifiguratus adelaidae]